MKREQKIVAIGAASGVLVMAFCVWFFTSIFPQADIIDATGPRLAYALGANVFALIPLFIMLITVSDERFFSTAIDPTRHAESAKMEIDGHVADNTLQQNFVFAVASLALCTIVAYEQLQVVWACAFVFVIARCVFWAGYRINPLYRAPGMSATAYMNLAIILYVLYHLIISL